MISIIVAMSDNYLTGRSGRLPWSLPSDLKRFRDLTMGHHLIAGRKTFESIGRALPGRTMIVMTRRPDYNPPGVLVAHGVQQALNLSSGDGEVFIIGGAEVYRIFLPLAGRIYLTRVHSHLEGDTYFPWFNESEWCVVEQSEHEADDRNEYGFTFQRLHKKTPC